MSPVDSSVAGILIESKCGVGNRVCKSWAALVGINATWYQRFRCNTYEMYRLRFMRYDIGLAVKKARLVRQLRCTWQSVAWHDVAWHDVAWQGVAWHGVV